MSTIDDIETAVHQLGDERHKSNVRKRFDSPAIHLVAAAVAAANRLKF